MIVHFSPPRNSSRTSLRTAVALFRIKHPLRNRGTDNQNRAAISQNHAINHKKKASFLREERGNLQPERRLLLIAGESLRARHSPSSGQRYRQLGTAGRFVHAHGTIHVHGMSAHQIRMLTVLQSCGSSEASVSIDQLSAARQMQPHFGTIVHMRIGEINQQLRAILIT